MWLHCAQDKLSTLTTSGTSRHDLLLQQLWHNAVFSTAADLPMQAGHRAMFMAGSCVCVSSAPLACHHLLRALLCFVPCRLCR
jgi:hypothetical protein